MNGQLFTICKDILHQSLECTVSNKLFCFLCFPSKAATRLMTSCMLCHQKFSIATVSHIADCERLCEQKWEVWMLFYDAWNNRARLHCLLISSSVHSACVVGVYRDELSQGRVLWEIPCGWISAQRASNTARVTVQTAATQRSPLHRRTTQPDNIIEVRLCVHVWYPV